MIDTLSFPFMFFLRYSFFYELLVPSLYETISISCFGKLPEAIICYETRYERHLESGFDINIKSLYLLSKIFQ